jgi:2',3'-cyclic-nucleotide 2'-phosphodiesterase (5'-nucleotidase family)
LKRVNKILAVTLALTCVLAPVSTGLAAPKTSVSDSNGNASDTRPAHLRTLEIALAALPADASQVAADGLADLQTKVQAATDAVAASVAAGSKDKKIESVDGYDRLAPAQARVAFLQAAVSAVDADKNTLAVGYGEGDKDTLVTQHLTLPTSGVNGTAITWASDNAAVVAPDGTVTRPAAGAGDAPVILTATLAKDTATATKTFPVTVKDLSPFAVQLLTINDLHGKIDQSYPLDITGDGKIDGTYGRIDYVASYLRQLEAKNPANTLLIHAGDATGGSSPVSSLNKEEPTIEILNALGFDGGTVGNHEFDKGVDELLRLKNGGQPSATPNYAGMKYPLVAANVEYKDSHELVLPPYFVQNVGGEKIGFIGVVTQSAAGMVMPAGIANVQFTDETQAVNKYAQELKAQGVKSIVVLAHMDASQDAKTGTVTGPAADLAMKADPEVDVVLAAHNHKVVNGTVNGKLVMQAFEYGKALGDVNLTIDPATHDIVQKNAEIVYVDQSKVQPDPEVGGILNKYLDEIKPRLEEVEGTAALPMSGGYAAVSDNALGNLIADSMKYEMQSDFALMNGGGIRDVIHEGPITWGELFNILPFNNILERLEIKGADLYPILNAQISKTYGGDFSVAGLKYTYDTATFKATSITLPDGTPIDPNKTYTLTVNNFMATATSAKYVPMGQLGKNPVIGPEDLPALVDYVKQYQGQIAYQPEGRISVTTSNVAVQNVAGATDSVTISALRGGNLVRLYRNADDATPFATKSVPYGQTSVTFTALDLGAAAGTFQFSVAYDSKPSTTEGVRIPVQFQGE